MINYVGRDWSLVKQRLEEQKTRLLELLTNPEKTERETQVIRGQIRQITSILAWEKEQPLNEPLT